MRRPANIGTAERGALDHAARYEALRRHALEPHRDPATREGVAVLLRLGVAAWMDACSKLPAPAVGDGRERPSLPDPASAELVQLLAAMALGHFQEVHA